MLPMLQTRFTRRAGGAAAAALALPLLAGARMAQAAPGAKPNLRHGAVYTQTNASAGNQILVFYRAAGGSLTSADPVATGGNGSGSGLGSQGALALSDNGEWLYAVNAGSNTISVLRVTDSGLKLVQSGVPSGGTSPISLTIHGHLLYVLNAGGAGNIAGFTVGPHGLLASLSGSTRDLGGSGTGPAQVSFTPDGKVLVVTQKVANKIATYHVGHDGQAVGPAFHNSSGATPFGFTFARHDALVVSQASGGAASYLVDDDGVVHNQSPTVDDKQSAACWAAATENGKYAYVANAGSGSISGYSVDAHGNIALLNPSDGITASTGAGSHPTDEAMSKGSRYLYVLLTPNSGSSIAGFSVGDDGSLHSVGTVSGLPVGLVGLAAR